MTILRFAAERHSHVNPIYFLNSEQRLGLPQEHIIVIRNLNPIPDLETEAIVATKIDKLSREERLRAMRTIEAVFEHPATAVSAETGEGLDELWKLIDRLTNKTSGGTKTSG